MLKIKKRVLFLILSTIILIFLIFVPEITSILNKKEYNIGAHRGNSITYTENTIEAINNSIHNDKYSFIEFDIRYTKDKKVILHHDDSLFKRHYSFEKISELNYSQIENISQYHIPLLEEILNLIENKKKIIVEIKRNENISKHEEIVDETIKILKKSNVKNENIMISSLSEEMIDYVQKNYPEYKTGIIYWITPISYVESEDLVKKFYSNITSKYIFLHSINLRNYDYLIKLKPKNSELLFWTFEDEIYLISNKNQDTW